MCAGIAYAGMHGRQADGEAVVIIMSASTDGDIFSTYIAACGVGSKESVQSSNFIIGDQICITRLIYTEEGQLAHHCNIKAVTLNSDSKNIRTFLNLSLTCIHHHHPWHPLERLEYDFFSELDKDRFDLTIGTENGLWKDLT